MCASTPTNPGKQAGSLLPWLATIEDRSLNFELGVDAQCQEMLLADGPDLGNSVRTTLLGQALVGKCAAWTATYGVHGRIDFLLYTHREHGWEVLISTNPDKLTGWLVKHYPEGAVPILEEVLQLAVGLRRKDELGFKPGHSVFE